MPHRLALVSLILTAMLIPAQASWAQWQRFRGPNGQGKSADAEPLPIHWSATENMKWSLELPGRGSSSPIVVDHRIYVTGWSGYGMSREDPGEQENLKRHLTCIDRESGAILWDATVDAVLPEDEYRGMFAEHGYATHTPVSDGERIFAFFGKTGAVAFDMDGNQLWQTGLGTESGSRGWGTSSSPILYKNLLIVPATAESEALVALDKETGEEVWRQEAAGFNSAWSTPILVKVDDSRTDIVMGVPYEIWGFNPETGKLIWHCDGIDTNSFCSSLVAEDGVVYAVEGRSGGSIAVRVGGKGDVTDSHVEWNGGFRNRIGTPIIDAGRIYFVAGRIATCIDAKSGEELFRSRLQSPNVASSADEADGQPQESRGEGRSGQGRSGQGRRRRAGRGMDYSSPILADGKIYYVSRNGDMFVLTAGDGFQQLAVNRVTNTNEDFSASPAASDGQLFFRSDRHLYCIEEK
jgi:outer membrane protein assembly factor BamB